MIAVGHELLQVLYVILPKKEPYRDPGVDCERLVVNRNAAPWIAVVHKYDYRPRAQSA